MKDLFDSGQMPEHGEEILQGEADEVPHEEIAAEIDVSTTVVHNHSDSDNRPLPSDEIAPLPLK